MQASLKIALALVGLWALLAFSGLETSASADSSDDERVKIGVYLESLCPDSRRFFLNQLVPASRQLGDIMAVTIVPFGHARVLANNRMICQHGPRECEGNRLMACLLARSSNQTDIIETFGCLFRNEQTPKECVGLFMPTLDFDEVKRCQASEESYALMLAAERETGRVEYVPKLTENGQYSEEIQQRLERDLKNSICRQYKGSSPPEACGQSNTAAGQ